MPIKKLILKSILASLLFFLLTPKALAQLATQGNEVTNIIYSNNIATLATNTPALNFSIATGTNTFVLPSPVSSAARIYVTERAGVACLNTFQVAVATTAEKQITSFNNSLSFWQTVPIISASNVNGTYSANSGLLNIPANGTIILTSSVIAGPNVAIFVVNTAGGCAATSIDVTVVFTPVSLTSPLLNVLGGQGVVGIGNQVQGVVPQSQNGTFVNPIMSGGVQNPVNGSFTTVGIDNFGSFFNPNVISTFAGIAVDGTVPVPSASGEMALAFGANQADSVSTSLLPPWTPLGSTCQGGAPQFCFAFLPNVTQGQQFLRSYKSATPGGNDATAFVLSSSPNTVVRQANLAASNSEAYFLSVLGGSTLMAGFECSGTASCSFTSVTDTIGLTWKLVAQVFPNNATAKSGILVYAATAVVPSTQADTVTGNVATGAVGGIYVVELTGTAPSNLNTPAQTWVTDGIGNQVTRLDAQSPNQFTCTVTLTTNTTTQCQVAATQVLGVNVRWYVSDFQINTTTAGTATTIQLKTGTGANCGTGTAALSAINYPNTVVGITNILGARMPLISPLNTAVCVTQAGTTAGTSVVELRGFEAP